MNRKVPEADITCGYTTKELVTYMDEASFHFQISKVHDIFSFPVSVSQVGSVDEESTKSDEEYDDLAMQDMMENGYWSEDEEEAKDKIAPVSGDQTSRRQRDKYCRNTENFFRTKSDPLSEPLCPYSSLLREKNEMRVPSPGNAKARKRSLSIPAMGKHGSVISEAILSGAPQDLG